MTAKARKSWRAKLADSKDLPKVEPVEGKVAGQWVSGTMVIPAPAEVDQIMRLVPAGKVTTINHIRELLAQRHRATVACPITTGIFAWIAAHAAEEATAEGEKDTTPYWRTLKSQGELNEKYPGGVESQAMRLQQEGHAIEPPRGKKPPKVKDFQRSLASL